VIFVTVGSKEPFDRLVRAVDQWADCHAANCEVSIQLGNGSYRPKACSYSRFLSPTEYMRCCEKARLIVAHAGMGSILTALEARKPIIVLARLMERGELLSEHQIATVRYFRKHNQVIVAESESDLVSRLNRLSECGVGGDSPVVCADGVNPPHSGLITYIRDFVSTGR